MKNLWLQPFYKIKECSFPVFRQDLAEVSLFYAPGYLVLTDHDHAEDFNAQLAAPLPSLHMAARLREHSLAAMQDWENTFKAKPLAPLCLTLYTSQNCNLNCSYCFSQEKNAFSDANLELEFIRQSAEEVAANCKNAKVPFTLVIHGGGEPTMDARLPDILSVVDKVADHYQLEHFHYLATNGVMSEEQAHWAVQNFDEIGLSCDGPADIQATQRPLKNGLRSTAHVERTAAIIRRAGKPLHIRATITSRSLERMPEIAAYLCTSLKASEVRIEPVFQGGRTHPDNNIPADQAEQFCASFLEARRVAAASGTGWFYSGSRLEDIHGRYCQIFRNVLNLVPGNGISACFKTSGRSQAQDWGMEIGLHDNAGFAVNPERVDKLQQILITDDPICESCVNRFHCTRGCPDYCPAVCGSGTDQFRCRLNRMLTTALLQERATKLAPVLRQNPIIGSVIQGGL
jgi:sulfatase maturation enzyme AslB (radical SAM superfamily)